MSDTKPARRSLCIVSRDPLQCSELVLSLQASLEPDDEVEIVIDRRRERGLFETEPLEGDRPAVERRRSADVDLEVMTKGFALVPGAATAPRPGRALGAASAVMLVLILLPSRSVPPDRVPVEAPTAARPEPAEHASRGPSKPPEGRTAAAHAARAPRPSRHSAIDAYAARVGGTSGRVLARARGLIERATNEMPSAMPMLGGPEAPADAAPNMRRPADSP